MGITLGRLIERRLQELGMSKAEFGRRISTSRQNVSLILRKESMDTKLLAKICSVLNYNFFQHLSSDAGVSDHLPVSNMPRVKLMIELNDAQQGKLLEMVLGPEQLAVLESL